MVVRNHKKFNFYQVILGFVYSSITQIECQSLIIAYICRVNLLLNGCTNVSGTF